MLPKIALFINGDFGISILKEVIESELFNLTLVVINSSEKQSPNLESQINNTLTAPVDIVTWKKSDVNKIEQRILLDNIDFGISAFFGHIIPENIIRLVSKDFINLHPSYLPLGRGAHPIAWGILKGEKLGITIHKLTKELDCGEIYFQKTLDSDISQNAFEIYNMAMLELIKCTKDFLPRWVSGNFKSKQQNYIDEEPKRVKQLEEIRIILFNEVDSAEYFIRRIQALDFHKNGSAVYSDSSGKKWSLRLRIEEL